MPLFAADGAGTGSGNGQVEEQSFDDVLKNEAHKNAYEDRVQKAVAAEKATWEAEQKKAEDQKALAGMPEKEKTQALLEAEKIRGDKLENEKNAILLKQMATSMLAEKGLATSMTGMVVGADEQTTKQNVDALAAAFAAAVADAIKEKVPGYTPKTATGSGGDKGGFMAAIREKQAKRK